MAGFGAGCGWIWCHEVIFDARVSDGHVPSTGGQRVSGFNLLKSPPLIPCRCWTAGATKTSQRLCSGAPPVSAPPTPALPSSRHRHGGASQLSRGECWFRGLGPETHTYVPLVLSHTCRLPVSLLTCVKAGFPDFSLLPWGVCDVLLQPSFLNARSGVSDFTVNALGMPCRCS